MVQFRLAMVSQLQSKSNISLHSKISIPLVIAAAARSCAAWRSRRDTAPRFQPRTEGSDSAVPWHRPRCIRLQAPKGSFNLRLQDNGRILRAEGNIGNISLFKLEEGGGIGVVPRGGGDILIVAIGELPLHTVALKLQHSLFIGDGQGEDERAALYALQIVRTIFRQYRYTLLPERHS